MYKYGLAEDPAATGLLRVIGILLYNYSIRTKEVTLLQVKYFAALLLLGHL